MKSTAVLVILVMTYFFSGLKPVEPNTSGGDPLCDTKKLTGLDCDPGCADVIRKCDGGSGWQEWDDRCDIGGGNEDCNVRNNPNCVVDNEDALKVPPCDPPPDPNPGI